MKRILMLAASGVILIPLAMWWFSPEQVIKRRTEHLMDVISMTEGAGGPLRQGKVYSMNGMLAPQVTLTIPDIADANGTFDKEEMESAFSWICQNAKQADFRITEFREIAINGGTADVRIIVRGFIELRSGGRPADGNFDVTVHWVKGGDGWRYDAVTWKNL